ncbi:MAG: hypothetical protein IPM18_10085 [Phycisphaerales bacterium]|nr:hypothetical protein [Phycisphaerales bacterium]
MVVVDLARLRHCHPAMTSDDPAYGFVDSFDAPERATRDWSVFAGQWKFESGAAHQSAATYDAGAARMAQPTGPYYLAVRFKPTSNFNGGGLFFALPQTDRKHGGMMVRCDPGGRVLWGWFDHGGSFNYDADATIPDLGEVEQELAVAVDPTRLGFNIYHDGRRIATNIRSFHVEGHVGIQTSGGPHTFTRVELRPATAAELEGITSPGHYSGIVDLVGSDTALYTLRRGPDVITRFDAQGTATGRLAATDLPGAPDDLAPVAIAWNAPADDHAPAEMLLLVGNGTTVYRVTRDLAPVGTKPLIHEPEMLGRGIAVGPGGMIFVADAAQPGIRVFAADGTPRLAYGEQGGIASYDEPNARSAGKFKQPRGIAINQAGQIVVTDRENYTYVVYRYDVVANELQFESNGPWLPYPDGVRFDREGYLLLSGIFEFYRNFGALRVLTLDGYGQRVFIGHSIRDLSDQVRTCEGPGGQYYIADAKKDRVVVLPRDFVEPLPEFEWLPDGGVKLAMTRVDGTPMVTLNHSRLSAEGGRVLVRQKEPVCVTWPPLAGEDLLTYLLPPTPPTGQRYVIDMPVLVAVFTRMTNERGETVEVAAEGLAERMARELEVDREFYWRNSYCTLNKQFEIMVIDEVAPQNVGAWVPPTEGRQLVNQVRRQRGGREIDVDHSLVVIHPMAGYDPARTEDPGYVGGGGLTPYAYSGYALWNYGQGWLMGHEWGHQLDAYFEKSGFHDWWLNHPDGTVHIGRYGEHWDCNAFLCRRADRMNWLRFRFGTLRLVDDRDEDGLPDDDATLPMDERRFGSDPKKADTDEDGLSDLDEYMAGTFSSSDPTRPDTTGNGVRDGKDPYAAFAVQPRIPAVSAGAEGYPAVATLAPIGRVQRSWSDTRVAAGYDTEHLYLALWFTQPVRHVYAPLDWRNDGWFIGRDNVYHRVDLEWDDTVPRVARTERCEARVVVEREEHVLQLKIRRAAARAPLQAGSSIGLILRLENGQGTVGFLLDPWQILGLELLP